MLVSIAALFATGGLGWPTHYPSFHKDPQPVARPQITQVNLNRNGGFTFQAGGQEFAAITRVSQPNGGWYTTAARNTGSAGSETTFSTPQVTVRRSISTDGTHIEIHDEVTNRTSSLVGIIMEDTLRTNSNPSKVWVGGREFETDKQLYNPANPSVFGQYGSTGIAIVAVDDLMRAQGKLGYHAATGLRIWDDSLGIQGNQTVNLVWSIYPTPSGDYWDFVNTVRADWNANFTLKGPFSYEPHFSETENSSPKSADYYGKWAKDRGLKYIVNGNFTRFANGDIAHGTAIPLATNFPTIKKVFSKIRQGNSGAAPLIYFHPQVSTEPDAEGKFADSIAAKKDGTGILYKNAQRLPLFIPTLDDSYGRALQKTAESLIAMPELGGLYWDEMSISYPEISTSGMVYGSYWDGSTVEINPTTHALVGQRSSVALAVQPFILASLGKLRSAGKVIVANTQPFTKTMLDQHIPRFVEGKSTGDIASTNLGVPLVLGNMKAEKTAGDAIKNAVNCLNQGAIYFGWVERWTPNTPDFNQLQFPITPVYLRAGTIIGKERILTTKSGDYGWADGSSAKVYVFDDEAVNHPELAGTFSGGKYHLNIPEGYYAILVKS